MFDISHDAPSDIGHCGKHRMESECKKKCKNIAHDDIQLYVHQCEGCQKKLSSVKKGLASVKNNNGNFGDEQPSTCGFNYMQFHSDGRLKSIKVYRDHLTLFKYAH